MAGRQFYAASVSTCASVAALWKVILRSLIERYAYQF
jgi:hypothetical protein